MTEELAEPTFLVIPKSCSRISLNKTTTCGRQLIKRGGPYCSYHDYIVRQDRENHVCSVCGIGVKSKLNLCVYHGKKERKAIRKEHIKKNRIFRKEFNRLLKINIY